MPRAPELRPRSTRPRLPEPRWPNLIPPIPQRAGSLLEQDHAEVRRPWTAGSPHFAVREFGPLVRQASKPRGEDEGADHALVGSGGVTDPAVSRS